MFSGRVSLIETLILHYSDCVLLQPEGFEQTYAEMDKTVKNQISHRGRALTKLKQEFPGL